MTDERHGWMLLLGDAGAGNIELAEAITADGGKHWSPATGNHGKSWTVRNGPNSLLVLSASKAWFLTTWEDDGPTPRYPSVAQTTDYGKHWRYKAMPHHFPWCADCEFEGYRFPRMNYVQPGRVCMDGELSRFLEGGIAVQQDLARWCLNSDGTRWSRPARISIPKPPTDDDRKDQGDMSILVDSRLTLARTCKADETYCVNSQTLDGGKTWREVEGFPTWGMDSVQTLGDEVWMLAGVDSPEVGVNTTLFYSPDHGGHWFAAPAPR